MALERASSAWSWMEWVPSELSTRAPSLSSARLKVMNEKLFTGVLIRERKRAGRSCEPLALLVVTTGDRADVEPSVWSAATSAVAAATRETDVLGWLPSGAGLGVILTDIRAVDQAIAHELDTRVRAELGRRLGEDAVAAFGIQLHVCPAPDAAREEGLWPLEPLLESIGARARTPVYDAIKRGADALGSLILLAALSPLLLIIAGLVKLTSPGSVLFKQTRIGQDAKRFRMLKFRTMHANADHGIHRAFVTDLIKATGQASKLETNGLLKIVNDPRVTPIGRILRKTSLDELPQLWNVLRGEMSLVGPRPPLSYEVEQYEPWHHARILEAKPGVTGLWQVTGRSRTTFDDMVRLDIRYARSRSLWTDLKILLATPAAVVAGKGAC